MQTYRILIEPVSPGTQAIESASSIRPGSGQFAKTPTGPVELVTDMTQVQIVGLQGYLNRIAAAADTSTVETAITALVPT